MTQTPASLLVNIASGHFSRRDGLDEFKNRFKFAFRSLMTLPSMLHWLGTFIEDESLLEFLRQNPRIACKLHRPYLFQSLGTSGKLKILEQHYALECARIPAVQLDRLLHGQHLALATIQGKDDSTFRFTVTHQHAFDKEGELSLQMWDAADIPLVTLTFTLCMKGEEPALIIGGLQGPRRETDSPDCIKIATKACHGLFPKRVTMEVLTVFARMLGLHRVQAVSKKQHIYNSWRYRKQFEADYDSFWNALEARTVEEGFFDIATQLPRKPFEEIASKKRAEYHRRYALLDEINAQVATSLL